MLDIGFQICKDVRGGIVTRNSPHELHFPNFNALSMALIRAGILPFRHKEELELIKQGLEAEIEVTEAQWQTFFDLDRMTD